MQVKNLITGGSPSVLHRNGNPAAWQARWTQLVNDFFSEPIERCETSAELTVLTWSNRPVKTVLERCLDRWGVPYVTLGQQVPKWRPDMKVFLNADALTRVTSEYVLALDADDVLLVAPPRKIVADFRTFDCDIVFSGEKNSFPRVPYIEEFERSIAQSVYCHLNSGAWIGTTAACRRFFRDCLDEDYGDIVVAHPITHVMCDDQGVTRKTFRRYHPTAQIDYQCRLFQSLYDVPLEGEVLITAGAEHAEAVLGSPAALTRIVG
jgi:hypothetical protein